jgi:acyl carrier protein
MSNEQEFEAVLRSFLKDEVMLSQIEFMGLDDELSLDSLAQTELRVFLEGKYDLDISIESMPIEVTASLRSLIAHISTQLKAVA